MRDFLFSLFEVSLTMGAVAALLLALSPVWKRRADRKNGYRSRPV